MTITTERTSDDDLAVYRETHAGFEHVGYVSDEAALEEEARASFEAHEGPQLPPPPPAPSGVVEMAPKETVLRAISSLDEMCRTEIGRRNERNRREAQAKMAELLAEGEWLRFGSVA